MRVRAAREMRARVAIGVGDLALRFLARRQGRDRLNAILSELCLGLTPGDKALIRMPSSGLRARGALEKLAGSRRAQAAVDELL